MRGLAALCVLFVHLRGQCIEGLAHPSNRLISSTNWMSYGKDAVAVFIVLSGFCLMLPTVRFADRRLNGGLLQFFKRRSLRILPPYYAALVLGILSILAVDVLKRHTHLSDGAKNAAANLTAGNILSHAFLIHDFRNAWAFGIEPPMWSVAVEWHIYFIFALLLLPLRRKAGIWITVAAAFLLGCAPHLLLPAQNNFDWACPWFIGLFAVGMLGAEIAFSDIPSLVSIRDRTPWSAVSIALAITTYGIAATLLKLRDVDIIMHPLLGCLCVSVILMCIRQVRSGNAAFPLHPLRMLESRAAMILGSFSYSLYLVHGLLITRVRVFMQLHHFHTPVYVLGVLVGGAALSLIAAYIFHLLFEKPFMTAKMKRLKTEENRAR
ncbi:hypothetical protein CCAX7_51580 [Capsulimonas corticalis]|uniref:Acyltransferase 3 domain-containing protein n=2 Tax=Capsulimonas corticalis TaxID=2219043 RepID=A0A9N7L8U3_9BACT|nr:hypothetical protein CCAX7_51580 [Capsulimonas corticalis]